MCAERASCTGPLMLALARAPLRALRRGASMPKEAARGRHEAARGRRSRFFAAATPFAAHAAGADADAVPCPVVHRMGAVVQARLLRRYKRFLADVELDAPARSLPGVGKAEAVTVHCPNTGPMTGLLDELPALCLLSHHESKTRKYAFTLEAICVRGTWVGVHSARANAVVEAAVRGGLLDAPLALGGGRRGAIQREVRVECPGEQATATGKGKGKAKAKGKGSSRRDLVVERLLAPTQGDGRDDGASGPAPDRVHIEVKAVTLESGQRSTYEDANGLVALFPDTVSVRAQKHMDELRAYQRQALSRRGGQGAAGAPHAAVAFLIFRDDCTSFCPADVCDPRYGKLVRQAHSEGVGILPLRCSLRLEGAPDRFGRQELVVEVAPGLAPLERPLWDAIAYSD